MRSLRNPLPDVLGVPWKLLEPQPVDFCHPTFRKEIIETTSDGPGWCLISIELPPSRSLTARPRKMMGKEDARLYFWDGIFSGANCETSKGFKCYFWWLGWVFSNIVYVCPDPWRDDSNWRAYISNGLVQPPTTSSCDMTSFVCFDPLNQQQLWKNTCMRQPFQSRVCSTCTCLHLVAKNRWALTTIAIQQMA